MVRTSVLFYKQELHYIEVSFTDVESRNYLEIYLCVFAMCRSEPNVFFTLLKTPQFILFH